MAEQRVTDEQLTEVEARIGAAPLMAAATLIGVDLPALIAEVRASRAREAELAQRIATVLAMCAAADTDETPPIMFVELLDPRTVRAVLE